MSKPTILITLGRWRLRRYTTAPIRSFDGLCLEHSCEAVGGHPWGAFAWTLHHYEVPCFDCQKPPADAIQAMFWFLKEE
jgi:hypothetical protein